MAHPISLTIVLVLVLAAWLAPGPAGAAGLTRAETLSATVAVGADAKVNINTAGVRELMTLSGVGPAVAEKILEYRAAHGPFKTPEEIRRVQGVGKGLWERNRDRIVVK